jgi:hypothetical protein
MELTYFLQGVCVFAVIGILYGIYLLRHKQNEPGLAK